MLGVVRLFWIMERLWHPQKKVSNYFDHFYFYFILFLILLNNKQITITGKLAAIHIAARRGDLKCLRLLLDHGADVSLTNKVLYHFIIFFPILFLYLLSLFPTYLYFNFGVTGRSNCPPNGRSRGFFKCCVTFN